MTTTPDRAEQVAAHVAELRPHVSHALGLCVLSAQARDELAAFIMLMSTEVAGRSRQISALLEAYWVALTEHGRGDATNQAESLGLLLPLRQEVDLTTAAEMTGLNPDTLRRAARENRISGRVVNSRWQLDVASVEAYKVRRAS